MFVMVTFTSFACGRSITMNASLLVGFGNSTLDAALIMFSLSFVSTVGCGAVAVKLSCAFRKCVVLGRSARSGVLFITFTGSFMLTLYGVGTPTIFTLVEV